jgi:anti-sigma factor RsiW
MTDIEINDAILIAFCRGETDEATTAAVEAAIDADPQVADRVARLMDQELQDLRSTARAGFAPLIEAPVPAGLASSVDAMISGVSGEAPATAVRSNDSLPADPVRKPMPVAANQNVDMRWAIPIAASLTLIAGAVGYLAATVGTPGSAQQTALFDAPGLERALSTVASGSQSLLDGGVAQFTAVSSFRDAGDRLCREFEIAAPAAGQYVGVACSENEVWQVTFAMATAADGAGYAPASSLEVLDSYLDGIAAGAPLTAEEEAALLSR